MALVTQINRDNSKSFICDYNSAAVHIICYFCSNTINYYMNIDENMTFSKSTNRRHCYVVSNLGTIDYIRKWELDEDLLEVCLFWFRCIKSSIRSYECFEPNAKIWWAIILRLNNALSDGQRNCVCLIRSQHTQTTQMADQNSDHTDWWDTVNEQYNQIHQEALHHPNITECDLHTALCQQHRPTIDVHHNVRSRQKLNIPYQQLCVVSLIGILCMAIGVPLARQLYEQTIGIRCFLPNNYLIWEATRPVADCAFCRGIAQPRILHNVTQAEFTVKMRHDICFDISIRQY